MNRRKFLKHSLALAPLVVASHPIAMAQNAFVQKLLVNARYKDKILVLIQLNGGNDGLNTFIPIDKYDILSRARKNILIPENKILKLNNTNTFGLHPAMTSIQNMYNNGMVSFIQGVGYPGTDFSHFQGIDIKYTATVGKNKVKSGWLGRYLEHEYPSYPKGYPQQPKDGPPSIRIGMVSPKIAQGTDEDLSVGISNIYNFNFNSSSFKDSADTDDMAGKKINTILAISKQIELYAPIIQSFAAKQKTQSKLYPEPEKNILADQLKMVAKLIGSGLDTRIYVVSQSGYDTHGEQVDQSDTTIGKHANLLKQLSEAISAFQDDIRLMGQEHKVLGMTFSEFGRRITSTASFGTDHGTAETVIMFGPGLKNGFLGTSPELPQSATDGDNLKMQFDFRSLYASVLSGWFGLAEDRIKIVIPQAPDERLDLFKV